MDTTTQRESVPKQSQAGYGQTVAPGCDSLADTLATILRTAPDHDTCVDALREAAQTADETAFAGTDHRETCAWVSAGPYRAFVSRTGPQRTLWTVASGCAMRLLSVGEAVAS